MIGIDGNEALHEKPFNNCMTTTLMSDLVENLNIVFSYPMELFITIWILVAISFIHCAIEFFYPPRYGQVNFLTFIFSKLYFK